MRLCEITDHQWALIETAYDAWQIDATRDDGDYILTKRPSTTYSKIVNQEIEKYGERMSISGLIDIGGIDEDEEYEEIIVYEGTVDGEWCRIYIPIYWD